MIYLDHNASTPLAPEVITAMQAALSDGFGNPSSLHWAGVPARALVEGARADVATLLGCAPDEIVFTSGGTEANNLALKGVFYANSPSKRSGPAHLISSAIEHPAVTAPLRFLERLGARVTWLPVDSRGQVDPDDLRQALRPETRLVSIMHANNEVGSIQPIAECAAIAREHGVLFHTDAAQSVGKIPTRVDDLGVDLLSIAGHKFQAPKGVGALYVRQGFALEPLLHGAGHEGGRRAGTESALLAAGLGTACRLAADLSPMTRVEALRERLWQGLQARLGEPVVRFGDPARCLPNTLGCAFVDQRGGELLARLDGIAASAGSACHAGEVAPSAVLRAMGVPDALALGAVRFSLGRETTADEIDTVVERVTDLLAGV
ncbi:cysteine desulfurase family protein [Halochromatium salexigens]|uniref:cysteine desulfurase family protein n=1 Tax=Halochromatium salexigens TaxID=49447 RepID=UPI001A9314E2|nr:cysteine desulfurase family protein [Halochromatium salexigens]